MVDRCRLKVCPQSDSFLSLASHVPRNRFIPHRARPRKAHSGLETLSKVAVARAEFCPLLTARATDTVPVMVIVRGVPICTQLTPSGEAAAVKVLPLRVSLTQ